MIQDLPPIFSLCCRQPAEANGAFPSLPLSFGTRRSYWSGGSLNSKSKELCVLQQPWYSPIQKDLPLPPLIWPHWRVSTDAWHIHSQDSRQPRLLAGFYLMIQSGATTWVIVLGMVGKRPWQDQRGKMLRVGCLYWAKCTGRNRVECGRAGRKISESRSLALGKSDNHRNSEKRGPSVNLFFVSLFLSFSFLFFHFHFFFLF